MTVRKRIKNENHTNMTIFASLIMLMITVNVLLVTRAFGQTSRMEGIHRSFIFADIHAHPSQFHRGNVERIDIEEIARYQRGQIDLVVCSVSSDAAFQGGYTKRDGTRIGRLRGNDSYTLQPGEAFEFTMDRFSRILKAVEDGDAALALDPQSVIDAKEQGRLALLAALEGADGLDGNIENLRELHKRGLRLLQLLHFRDNDLGFNQTSPYLPGGLTEFGREVVRECNRLGIIVDLAHSNTETIMDALEISEYPIIFSHTGIKALYEGDRYLNDDEIRAIAAKGGMIGIWPSSVFNNLETMMRHIDYVKHLVGIDHVGIASDLRGTSYIPEFGQEADFQAITKGLIDWGYTDEEVGKVMGGNFFRIWQVVTKDK